MLTSCLGAAQFGYHDDPYYAVIAYVILGTAGYMVWTSGSLRQGIRLADKKAGPASLVQKSLFIGMIFFQVATVFLLFQSIVFFLVREVANYFLPGH
jgi:hypothetical protein